MARKKKSAKDIRSKICRAPWLQRTLHPRTSAATHQGGADLPSCCLHHHQVLPPVTSVLPGAVQKVRNFVGFFNIFYEVNALSPCLRITGKQPVSSPCGTLNLGLVVHSSSPLPHGWVPSHRPSLLKLMPRGLHRSPCCTTHLPHFSQLAGRLQSSRLVSETASVGTALPAICGSVRLFPSLSVLWGQDNIC